MLKSLLRLLWELACHLQIQLLLVGWLAFGWAWAGVAAKAMLLLGLPVMLLACRRRHIEASALMPAKRPSWYRFEDVRNVSSAVLLGVCGHLGWAGLALVLAAGVVFHRTVVDDLRSARGLP